MGLWRTKELEEAGLCCGSKGWWRVFVHIDKAVVVKPPKGLKLNGTVNQIAYIFAFKGAHWSALRRLGGPRQESREGRRMRC